MTQPAASGSWRWPAMAWDHLVVFDPQRERFLLGARVALTTALATLVLAALARHTSMPSGALLVGAMMAMMSALSVQDPDPAAARTTMLLVPLPALAGLGLGALTPVQGWSSSLVLLAVIGAAMLARRWGARGTALGMVGFFSCFAAQMVNARLAQLPWLFGAVVVSVGVLLFVRRVALRDRPERGLLWLMDAYRRSLSVLLAHLADAVREGDLNPRVRQRLRKDLRRVNELAILVENALGPDDRRAFAVELALEAAVSTLNEQMRHRSFENDERATLADALLTTRSIVRGEQLAPRISAPPVWADRLPGLHEALLQLERAPLWLLTPDELKQLSVAQALTARKAADETATAASPPAEPVTEAATTEAGSATTASNEDEGLHPTTRQALQAVVACGLSMVVGRWLSPDRWMWAVIAAFVVFSQATTRGETLLRAWHRIAGTVAGALLGLGLAHLSHGHRNIELALIFAALFLGPYLARVSYAWMVMAMSVLVAVLYDLMGALTPHLLIVRIDETLVGASIGAVVATLLMPSRTMDKVRMASATLLRSLEDYLRQACAPGRTEAGLLRQVRQLDAQLRALQAAALPLIEGVVVIDPVAARLVQASGAMVFLSRQLAAVAPYTQIDPQRASTSEHLATRAARLALLLQGESEGTDGALAPLAPRPAVRWLDRIDEALDEIEEAAHELRPVERPREVATI